MTNSTNSPMAKDTDLSWDVTENEVYVNINGVLRLDETKKAIVRNDNEEILSHRNSGYHTMTNEKFKEATEDLRKESGFEFAGFHEYKGGRKVIGYLKNTAEGEIKIGDHVIEDYLILGNSHDGSSSFFTGTVTELLRCSNEFGRISGANRVRHSKSFEINFVGMMTYIKSHFAERQVMYNAFNRFGDKIVSPELFDKALDFVLKVDLTKEISSQKQNQKDALRNAIVGESNDLGDNLWGLFNGVTKYTTHELNGKDRVFGNVLGNANNINQRAYQFCTANS